MNAVRFLKMDGLDSVMTRNNCTVRNVDGAQGHAHCTLNTTPLTAPDSWRPEFESMYYLDRANIQYSSPSNN